MPVTVLVAPGPLVTSTTPGPARGSSVTVRHVGSPLFVSDQNQLDLGSGGDQSIENRNRRSSGQTQMYSTPSFSSPPDQRLSSIHRS